MSTEAVRDIAGNNGRAALSGPPPPQAWIASWQHEFLFYQVDANEQITFISPSVRGILGYEPEELVGRKYRDFIDLDHPLHAQLQDLSDRLLAGGGHGLRRCVARRRDGRLAFLAVRERLLTSPRGEQVGREVMAHDETARVNAELSLRQSERKYRRLVEGLKGDYVIYSHDSRGVITYASPSVRDVLGWNPQEIVGKSWRELVGRGSYGRAAAERVSRDLANGKSFHKLVVEVKHANGSPRLLELQERPVYGYDGRYQAMEGIAKDVTEATRNARELQELKEDLERRVARRTAQLSRVNAELRRGEARYRNVVETQSEFITRWLPGGIRTFVNEAYCRFVGKTRDELLGRSFFDVIHREDRAAFHAAVEELTPGAPAVTYVHRAYKPNGEIAYIQFTDRAFFDAAGNPIEYQSVGRDVTDLYEADERLREQEVQLAHVSRLATMGEMVAGIAHEVRQPLHAARTFAEAARRHLERGAAEGVAAAIECTHDVESAINRTTSIIRRLRNFTKLRPVQLEQLDVSEVLQESIEVTTFEARRAHVTQSYLPDEVLPPIEGDHVQLQQVFVNLMLNAYEAMATQPEGERTLLITARNADGAVDVAFRDSGVGVPAAARDRLFDAFFTTKESGMGMGLALCRSIAAAHRALLWFESNDPEPGSTFHIRLPSIPRPQS